jgi:MYXO-CTERM domain-containing protein
VNGGDYDNAAWMLSWAWPYVYVGGTGNGIYVVDAHDPMKPKLVTRIQTGELGGFRIGPVYAAGNYIVASGMDGVPTKMSVLDAGDPASPFLLATAQAPSPMYSSVVIGDRIYGTGEGGQYSFMKWTPTAIQVIGTKVKMGSDKGGYCTYQDAFIFCGQSSEGFRKIDVSDEKNFHEVETFDIPNEATADTDFATVLGNLVYLGNDHGTGAALFAHQMAPDTNPPKLLKGYPENGDLHQPLGSRITLFFSDEIDLDSVKPENVIVRPVNGEAISGVFSHSSFNAVSFGAKESLKSNTTYEVVVVKGGLTDLAKNPIAEQSVLRFSTGDTIETPTNTGGSGGMSMGGSAGSAGDAPSGAGMAGTTMSSGGSSSSSAGTANSSAGTGTSDVAGSSSAGATATGGSAATPEDAGGCGCAVPGHEPSGRGLWLLGAGLLAGWRRRNRVRGARL